MLQARGYKGRLILDFESIYAQNPTIRSGRSLPFNSLDVKAKQNLIDTKTIRGNRNPVEPDRGNIEVSGNIVIPVDSRSFSIWLKALLGSPTTIGSIAPYTHTYKVVDNQPSFILEKGFTDIRKYSKMNGCKINSLKMSIGGDGELVATLDILGANEDITDIEYQANPTEIILERFSNFQAEVIEGGNTLAIVTDLEFTIATGLDGSQYVLGGNGVRRDIPEGLLDISGTLTALFTSTELLDKAKNGTKSSIKLKFSRGDHSLEFLFNELIYEFNSPGINGPAGIKVDLAWRAFLSSDPENSAVIVKIVNDMASI